MQGVGVVERSVVCPPGQRVWFATSAGMAPGDGALAELCAVPDADVVPLGESVTDGLPDDAVAALGLSAVAAWMSLTWRARLMPGEKVVVLGAGGAVGQVAVGAARALGAERVVAVARPGDSAARAASRVLGPGGRLVNLGGASGDLAELSSSVLRSRSVDVLGYTNNALTPAQRAEAITAVVGQAARGALAVAHTVLPLAEVAEGRRRTAEGVGGRIVHVPERG